MKYLVEILLVLLIANTMFAQKDLENYLKTYHDPEELVTLSASIPFEQAIEVLSKVSEKTTGQKIVSTAGFNDPIGIEIDKMQYKRALKVIVQYNNLIYDEKPDVIIVKKKEDQGPPPSDEVYASVDSREVKISAVFFEANITEMRERGINWQFLFSKNGFSIGSSFKSFLEGKTTDSGSGTGGTTQQQTPPDFNVSSSSEFSMGKFDGSAEALFKFFEEENLGEIIARPSVTVREGITGRVQIGEDISVKQRDFSGNIIDVFIPTGTIIDVTPYIYKEEGISYILLKLNAERSSGNATELTTKIAKTTAKTEVLMLDKERTVIGGLFLNEETKVRRGIPFLKDLPWWFFGLRYIFGYDSKQVSKKEVIILIEAEIVPTLKERISEKKKDVNLIQQEREKNALEMMKYKIENMKKKDGDGD